MNKKIFNINIALITPILLLLSVIFKIQIYIAIAVCLLITIIVNIIKGYSYKELFIMMKLGVMKVKYVIIMLFLIGILISVWMKMGTIPSMIYYGTNVLSNTNILLAAFLSCSVMSMIIGTGIGTLSTMGLVYIGITNGLNIPLAPVVGAIVSGAYLGDRTSPMSSSLNLISNVTEISLHRFLSKLIKTTVPTFIISVVFYWIIGKNYSINGDGFNNLMDLRNVLYDNETINLISLVPPLIIILEIAVLRWSIVKSLLISLIASILIGFWLIPAKMINILSVIIFGYHPKSLEISSIMSGGGILSMKNVLIVIILSTALCGIFDGTKALNSILEKISKKINNGFNLFLYTGLTSLIISIVTFNQTLASIIPGKYLSNKCDEIGVERETFALSISDIGMITVPIIPWNVNAILVVSITQISTLKYLPFSVFCWGLPIISIIISFIENNSNFNFKFK